MTSREALSDKKQANMKLTRSLRNESGVAALVMVIAALIIVSLVGLNFVVDQQNKHQGSAVTVNAEQAQSVAEAGYRYAVKCLLNDDPACACNSGGDCATWSTVPDIPVTPFGAGANSNFRVTFTNKTNCTVKVSSIGTVNNTVRIVENVLTRNVLAGGGGTVTLNNPQAALRAPTAVPINILNHQTAFNLNNGNFNIQFPNYTVPAGQNLVLVVTVGASGNGNSALSAEAFFGGALMNLAGQVRSGGGGARAATTMYYLPVTAGQTANITASFAGSTQNRWLSIVTLENALSPPEATETRRANGNISDNITTLTDNAMIISSAYSRRNNDIVTTGTNHTEITGVNEIAEAEPGMGFVRVPTAGNVNGIGYNIVGGGGGHRTVQVLAAFPPASQTATISLPYTVPGGLDLILVVSAGAEDGIAPRVAGSTGPISATFMGNTMNIIDTGIVASGGGGGTDFEAGLGLFWIPVTAGDSGDIVVTITDASIDEATIHAYTLIGAQGPPQEIVPIISDTTRPPNTILGDFTSVLTAGSMIVTGGYHGQPSAISAVPGGTHTVQTQVTAGSSRGIMGNRPVPSAATPTGTGWNSFFNRILLGMASFPPAGGGPCL